MEGEVKKTEKDSKFGNLPGPGPGRPKGSENKFTNLKNAFLEVFDRLDGVDGLEKWVRESKYNKRLFYQWITKMLPSSVVGKQDDDGEFEPLKVVISNNGNPPDDGNEPDNAP